LRVIATGLTQPAVQGETTVSTSTAPTDAAPTDSAPTAPASLASNGPPCEPGDSPTYCVYTVQAGDTLSAIAQKFGLKGNEDVTAAEFLVHSNKPNLTSEDDLLQIDQKLRIPKVSGVIHEVVSSQTLTDVADMYGVSLAAVAEANNITDLNSLRIGQQIVVPDPTRFFTPAPPAPPPPTASASSSGSTAPRSTGTASRSGFIWPTTGPLSSYFGPSHPLGIDIDLFSNPNAPVVAAMSGTVVFAGGNACCSYGYYVVIDHGNGYETLYAHFSKIAVSVGQRVNQGDVVGYGGRTGYATGNHLHFEVRYNGSIINPLTVLP
jgi:murein DD-endopeptidase MepM/ murein hydrolase activator NlpD